MTDRIDLKSLRYDEIENLCRENGLPRFRAKQIFSWISRGVTSFDEMTDLSKDIRALLSEKCYLTDFRIEKKLVSSLDGTVKYLIELTDGQHIECVVMNYHHGQSLCMSTQVGCAMGCAFCASTKNGLIRNLTAGEMLDEFVFISKDLGQRLSTIVLMGIGEPLHNFDNLIRFLDNINDERGVNLSHRHITLSTCGIVPKIKELADKKYQINLALSLHAATDEKRKEIMPIAKRYSLKEIIDACVYYENSTGRRITFEYTLISGVNDKKSDADNIVKLLMPLKNAHVNLISVNPIDDSGNFLKVDAASIERFAAYLKEKKVNATVRRSMGADISGSCGQLRNAREGN